jgi:hypothetical protein
LRSDGPVDQDAILAAYYASENYTFFPIRNTYEDLQSTGNIRLLDDIELRLALASYHSKGAVAQTNLAESYRKLVRGVIPWKIQATIREYCPTTEQYDEVPTGFPSCTLPGISADEVNAVFAALRAYPGIFETLTYRVSDVDVAVYLYQVQKQRVMDVLTQL